MHRAAPKKDIDEAALTVTPPKTEAVGVKAVTVALERAVEEMGVIRTARTLTRVNQRHGFDCPGCAWPEPTGIRRPAEFCENGAKAVAEEATLRTVTPEFFAAHSIAELAGKSGYWLGQQGRLTHPMVLRPGDTHYSPVSWDDAYQLIAENLRELDSPTRRCSTPPAAPPMRRHSCISCWCAASARTTCRTARICATSPRARR